MRTLLISFISLLLLFGTIDLSAEVSGDVYVAGVSKYLWRGQNLFDGFALQPGADLNIGSISLGFWGSYGVDPCNLNEADITVSYAVPISAVMEMSLGYTFYTFPEPVYGDSHEAFAGLSFACFLSPGITFYYDFDDGDGLYTQMSASYPFVLGLKFSLDGSLGFNAGQWGYDSSLTVFGLDLSASIPIGPVEITPSLFGQLSLDDQYESNGFVSLSILYNF
ncbi:MAG: hypothetical protein KKH98_13510 [Spirochaetes bacterium]|nr:hypothetical protein [Spirochaetota bacterium]